MKRVVVSRLFNVLSDWEDAISTSTMLMIDKIRQDNNIFVVMDNCHYKDVLFYDISYPFIDYIIACNGSYVYDCKKKKVVFKKKLLLSTLKRIEKLNCKKLYYLEDKVVDEIDINNDEVYKVDLIYYNDDINIINKLKINSFKHDNIIEINRMSKYEALTKLLKDKYDKKAIISIGYDNSDKEVIKNSCGYLVKEGDNNNKIVEKILKEHFKY